MYRSSIMTMEIGEPLSLILAILALIIAVGGPSIIDPGFYKTGTFIGILVGFLLHEMAHRQVARRYGMLAEFIAFIPGLLVTIASSILPIIILAPGYVRTISYYGYSRGVIESVMAGPLVNIILAGVGLAGWWITGSPWLHGFGWINGLIAVFNLLPIPPLDGEKIMRMNMNTWIMLFIPAIVIYALL